MVEPLTDREREILARLAEQLSNDEIAPASCTWPRRRCAGTTRRSTASWASAAARRQWKRRGRKACLATDPAPSAKHNLPSPTTPFVGRGRELARVTALLADPHARLVTMLAPGGMGKTRLALEAARLQLGQFADGVFFVALGAAHHGSRRRVRHCRAGGAAAARPGAARAAAARLPGPPLAAAPAGQLRAPARGGANRERAPAGGAGRARAGDFACGNGWGCKARPSTSCAGWTSKRGSTPLTSSSRRQGRCSSSAHGGSTPISSCKQVTWSTWPASVT